MIKSEGLEVESYGVGSSVKLPGPTAREPNVYPFGTPYQTIYDELKSKDEELYERNGLLKILSRNLKVKTAPERWQDNHTKQFDVVISFDDGVFDKLMDDIQKREQKQMKPFLVINMAVKDNPIEAGKASPQALQLCRKLEECDDWEDDIEDIIEDFSVETGRKPFYTICFH